MKLLSDYLENQENRKEFLISLFHLYGDMDLSLGKGYPLII